MELIGQLPFYSFTIKNPFYEFHASRFTLHASRFTLALIFLITANFGFLIAQTTTQCGFTNQSTLCQLYGTTTPNIQLLTNSSSSGWIGGWNSSVIYINATFTVNTSFSITDCVLRFGPGGSIVVTSGGSLNSSNTSYFGCAGWPGMTLNGTGSIILTNNKFEDASYALTIASSNASATITNNTYNRNIIDIYVLPGVAANALITNNVFDCTSNTVAGSRSDIGIYTQKAVLTFGLPLTPHNIIRNHRIGALSTNSTLNIRNAEFACNEEQAVQTYFGHLDVRTDPALANFNYFFRNRADILTEETSMWLQRSNFTQCLRDNVISIGNTHAQTIEIRDNIFFIDNNNQFVINNYKTAIGIDRSSGTSGSGYKNNIQFNTIGILPFTPNQGRTAIRAVGFSGTSDFMYIRNNGINIEEGGSSPTIANESSIVEVAINRADGFILKQNAIGTQNIDNANNRNRWGFYLHGWLSPSSQHAAHLNSVTGTSTDYDYGMCAFHMVKTGPWQICDNTTNYTLRGFHIAGECYYSVFGGNIMGDHRHSPVTNTGFTAALILEPDAKIGPQFCRHNLFTYGNYSPDKGAEHRGPQSLVIQSRFDVSPLVPQEMPVPVSPGGWFFYNDSCSTIATTHCGTEAEQYKVSFSEIEWEIIEQWFVMI